MSRIFIVLAIISGGVALSGYVWSVGAGLRARRAPAAGAEEAHREAAFGPAAAATTEAVNTTPVGGEQTEERQGFSLAGAGREVRRGGWRRALPVLLASGGMLALLLFGALALLTSLPSKLFGFAALGIAVYISVTELRSFSRAVRH